MTETKTTGRIQTDIEFHVLHTLRVRGLVSTGDVAGEVQLSEPAAITHLDQLERGSLVLQRAGRVSGWALTPAGRTRQAELLDQERLDTATQTALNTAYDHFVTLNEPFKGLCTDWQTNQQPRRCIVELQAMHPDVDQLAQTVARLDRMASYRSRFDIALTRLGSGDDSAFTSPLVNSYHDVWMQLHHDLLITLRRERTAADGH